MDLIERFIHLTFVSMLAIYCDVQHDGFTAATGLSQVNFSCFVSVAIYWTKEGAPKTPAPVFFRNSFFNTDLKEMLLSILKSMLLIHKI